MSYLRRKEPEEEIRIVFAVDGEVSGVAGHVLGEDGALDLAETSCGAALSCQHEGREQEAVAGHVLHPVAARGRRVLAHRRGKQQQQEQQHLCDSGRSSACYLWSSRGSISKDACQHQLLASSEPGPCPFPWSQSLSRPRRGFNEP